MHGVEGGALQQLISCHPKAQAVLHGAIFANPPNLAIVPAGQFQRQWVTVGGDVVVQVDPRRSADRLTGKLERYRLFELGAHGDRVGAVDRHAHTGHARLKVGQAHDLARLVHHFHFLLRVTVVEKHIDMRQN
ncbi:uncharacterized protein METZ01_LOCUS163262, partial [marine metagenome]